MKQQEAYHPFKQWQRSSSGVQESAPSALSRSIDIVRESGASTWLSALPLRDPSISST